MSFKLLFQQDKSAVLRFNSTTIGMSEVLRMKAKCLKFTKDLKLVLLMGNGKLQIRSLEEGDNAIETNITADCYETSLASIYFSANDQLQIYNRSNGKITTLLDLPKITFITVNQDDSRLGIIANSRIYILTLKSNTLTALKLPTTNPTSISFYPFKKSVILAGFEDGSVAMWDVNLSSSPSIYKAMVHNAPVKAVSFAPCNKHFYCSVGMDGRLLFHDINARSGKGLLQEYKAEGPLMCLTINDDHTVAAGTDSGTILIYDLRLKKVICRHETESNLPVVAVQWQPPKWALNAAMKEPVKDYIPEVVEDSEPMTAKETIAAAIGIPAQAKPASVMDIFSPVNKNKVVQQSSMLKSATLGSFQEKLKNSVVKQRASSEVQSKTLNKDDILSKSRSLSHSETNQGPGSNNSIESTPGTSNVKSFDNETPAWTPGHNQTPKSQSTINSTPNALKSAVSGAEFTPSANNTPCGNSSQAIPLINSEAETPKAIPATENGNTTQQDEKFKVHTEINTASDPLTKSNMKSQVKDSTPKSTPNLASNQPPLIPPTPLEKLHGYLDNPKIKQAVIKDERIGGLVTDTLEVDVIRRVVDQVVEEHFVEIKNDIQQMHIEILREFQLQRMEIEEMVERHVPAAKLLELVERLTEENDRLKRTF